MFPFYVSEVGEVVKSCKFMQNCRPIFDISTRFRKKVK